MRWLHSARALLCRTFHPALRCVMCDTDRVHVLALCLVVQQQRSGVLVCVHFFARAGRCGVALLSLTQRRSDYLVQRTRQEVGEEEDKFECGGCTVHVHSCVARFTLRYAVCDVRH